MASLNKNKHLEKFYINSPLIDKAGNKDAIGYWRKNRE